METLDCAFLKVLAKLTLITSGSCAKLSPDTRTVPTLGRMISPLLFTSSGKVPSSPPQTVRMMVSPGPMR